MRNPGTKLDSKPHCFATSNINGLVKNKKRGEMNDLLVSKFVPL